MPNKALQRMETLEVIPVIPDQGSSYDYSGIAGRALRIIEELSEEVRGRGYSPAETERDEVYLLTVPGEASASRQSFFERISRASYVYTGFESALEWLAERFQEQTNDRVTFINDGKTLLVDRSVGLFLYDVTKELLTNVEAHANAHDVTISIEKDDATVRVIVEDDGKGFTRNDLDILKIRRKWYGFLKIKEGVSYFGGTLRIESAPGKGTRVTVAIPAEPDRS